MSHGSTSCMLVVYVLGEYSERAVDAYFAVVMVMKKLTRLLLKVTKYCKKVIPTIITLHD